MTRKSYHKIGGGTTLKIPTVVGVIVPSIAEIIL